MNYIQINRIVETDFDAIVEVAGGEKIDPNVYGQKGNVADYRLNEAIIELKLVREEGLTKITRRGKVAEIFRKFQPDRPVVVLDPKILSKEETQKYYNLMEQPIQTAVKKAAKQLHDTELRDKADSTRVLVILNDGYTALNMDEFRDAVGKRIRNDTSKIDHAIVGGIYFYSDRFDNYFFTIFDLIPVNINRSFPSFEILRSAWNQWVEKYMTAVVIGQNNCNDDRLPVIDVNFEIDGIDYIKICPPMGIPSNFWPGGKRPRENSTGIESCPPVATCFPRLSKANWLLFKDAMPNEFCLQNDYTSWLEWSKKQEKKGNTELQPFINIDISFDGCTEWFDGPAEGMIFSVLCQYAVEVFQNKINLVIDNAINKKSSFMKIPSYIYLLTEEIGQDKAFDISSIFYINETPGFEREQVILKNKKIFFEYALSLASSYAVGMGLNTVVYERDERYAWI